MRISDIYESTTAGAIATVAQPMTAGAIKRSNVGKGIYGDKNVGSLLTGKKTNKPYANSLKEGEFPGEDVCVIYIDGKSGTKVKTEQDAKGQIAIMKKKHPDKKYEIKKEVRESKTHPLVHKAMTALNTGALPQEKHKAILAVGHKALKALQDKKTSGWWNKEDDENAKKHVHRAMKAALSKEINESKVESPNGVPVDLDPNKYYVWAWDGCVVVYGKFDSWEEARQQKPSIEDRAVQRLGPHAEGKFKVASGSDLLFRYVKEARLEEDDVILVPGQGRSMKTGFVPHDPDRAEHEGETLKNSLRTIVRVASELNKRLDDQDNFPEWVSEKVGAIKGMMTSVMQYLASEQEAGRKMHETGGVIAGGGVGEGKKADRMVKYVTKSEEKTGKSKKEAENIAWATANKRGYLDNKNHIKGK